ncbi:MAG: antibiotic biosynthesis monooxygenase [Alphaproteobacteria bacterium]|jgi:heme-degrading monooxygenase HmoA|nr:antibiotic biosynthesis monooxygenase [Alphaproteobacteria bacterium]MBT4083747.1 antibiotic biosynthesis monooxygenase [Alphaproteobacteria bacterium]MBT4545269.1 antibiotic biosynthesis monooxygenase [Alphaproteobacteria bacterium]MBT6385151.1 antibiotic biosynthesis monooxygenase [Alphaproteobacteria bacterium]MBT7744657.1 antibiotic biosynthesis monooxygenase [Alphaproteobacteria bacterium]
MIAVIFEFQPDPAQTSEYFDVAAELRPLLEDRDGFISIERFESVTSPGRFVSLSFWRDEEAVQAWRNVEEHRVAQRKGRDGLFQDYRLRVASVLRDYTLSNHEAAPDDSIAFHDK